MKTKDSELEDSYELVSKENFEKNGEEPPANGNISVDNDDENLMFANKMVRMIKKNKT